jgi:hypothetical protein
LGLAGVGGGGRLAGGASSARQGIAEIVHGNDVGVIEEVEDVGD